MHPNLNSPYTTFTLSEQEETESAILSPTQRARVQNLRVETLEQKLSLAPSSLTPDSKESYWQQEAYLRGQLDILSHLLAADEAAQSLLHPLED